MAAKHSSSGSGKTPPPAAKQDRRATRDGRQDSRVADAQQVRDKGKER